VSLVPTPLQQRLQFRFGHQLKTSCILFLALTLLPVACFAQAAAAGSSVAGLADGTASATTNGEGPAGIIPYSRGFNLSLGTSSQHDSSSGWSSVLTPGVAYRFSRVLSADVSVPIYAYINVYVNTGTKAKPVYTYATQHGVLGDTSLAAHLGFHSLLDYTASVSLGLPSGNSNYGLGAGQPTFDLNHHFERNFGFLTPDIEAGFGDSTSLVNRRVRKSYTAVGYNSHFQAGLSLDLPHNLSFSTDAYEQLPLSTATIYSTTGRGKKKVTTATPQPSGEDNGFLTSLDVPFNGHVTLSGFYNRSLRAHDDVAGFSFTFLLKAPTHSEATF
jgi:hypothetical protein